VAVLAFTATGAGVVYAKLNSNVEHIDISGLTAPEDPSGPAPTPDDPSAGTPLDYLVIGSDDRSGENGRLTDHATTGMRGDTTMVVHVSANRKRVDIVSIPRDTMVQIPSCTMTDGQKTSATFTLFNTAFALGADRGGDLESAVACTWKTVESITGVSLDGAVVVDFTGFKDMVDALGGVPMCVPEDTVSPEADLDLKAGFQTLNGKQALGYARARKGVGQNFDGSDITRTGRQQQLLAAMFNEVKEQNFLTDLPKLYGFADALTKSLTVTDTLKSTKKLVGLAYAMRGIRPKNVTFMTIPIGEYPQDHYRVIMTPAADAVWQHLIDDEPLADRTPQPARPATKTSIPTQTKTPAREAFNAADKTAVCD
jgi:LCP family protein required for cell wall assembly